MSERKEYTIKSHDGKTNLRVVVWKPDGEIKAIAQLSHGMVEHINRYDEFARYLNDKGYLVVGSDHLGHGWSVESEEKLGYFCEKNADWVVVDDLNSIREMIQKDYPNLPYFILGHSMGSLIVRNYITKYSEGLAGAVIIGTGIIPNGKLKAGLAFVRFLTKLHGPMYRSNVANNMVIGANDKKFLNTPEYPSWMSKNNDSVNEFNADPRCGYIFTLNGFETLLNLALNNNNPEYLARIPKTLPLFIVSGADCCLGEFGKGVKKVYEIYKNLGIEDITWKLYENDRHEILNEPDRDIVYKDILSWMNIRIPS